MILTIQQKNIKLSVQKPIMIVPTNLRKIFLTTTAIAAMAFSIALSEAQAQTPAVTDGILIAQKLGKIQKKIELSEVPVTVLSAATAASGSSPTYAQVEINTDGALVYELGGQNQQGFDFEIDIKTNGQIVEIDEQIETSAVPEEVMKAFKYWFPDRQITAVWRSTRYTTFDYYYEIIIGEDFWVEIPADGKTLKINPLI